MSMAVSYCGGVGIGWVQIVGRSTLCGDGEEDEGERSEEKGEVVAIY
jgi:hypothetical protein